MADPLRSLDFVAPHTPLVRQKKTFVLRAEVFFIGLKLGALFAGGIGFWQRGTIADKRHPFTALGFAAWANKSDRFGLLWRKCKRHWRREGC